jgi:hypothetical protein
VDALPQCGQRKSETTRYRRGSGFSFGEGASAIGTGSPQNEQSTTKYHFPGSVNFGMARPRRLGTGAASFNSWNGDKQQHKPQQDYYRNEGCQNADRNSNKGPAIFPDPFAHDYLLIAFPPPSARLN